MSGDDHTTIMGSQRSGPNTRWSFVRLPSGEELRICSHPITNESLCVVQDGESLGMLDVYERAPTAEDMRRVRGSWYSDIPGVLHVGVPYVLGESVVVLPDAPRLTFDGVPYFDHDGPSDYFQAWPVGASPGRRDCSPSPSPSGEQSRHIPRWACWLGIIGTTALTVWAVHGWLV